MTYPKSTLAGLTEALKIAAEPSPLAKNRVWVDGKPHQKQQVYTDPTTGEKKFITNVHEPAFMDQVMRAMPAAVSGSVDILNQPREDAVADWEMRNKGLHAAVSAEAQMALARQREATAGAIPTKLAQGERALDIRQMDAETRARLAQLRDLSDSEKIRLLQEGKVSLQELRDAAAMQRVETQQAGATQRTGMQQAGATQRTGMQQAGASRRQTQRGQQAIEQIGARTVGQLKVKQTPSGSAGATSQLPTQQKVAAQIRANQAIQDFPEWEDYLSVDQNGMVHIEPPSKNWWDAGPDAETYNAIKTYLRGGMTPAAAEQPKESAKPPATPAAKPPAKLAASTAKQPTSGTVRVQAPNGQTGTWDYSKGPLPKGFKILTK
jgi:hypothetical protein